ncbi:MAG TPA: SoxXA-binding protein [Nitrospirae bacterium]|nr:SoxXA-binding protein [Nitrospirota bacterium]
MKKVIIFAALLTLSACAGTEGPSYDEVVAQAKKEMKVAKSMDALWRDTGKFLKKADKAKENGDDAKAMKLAKKALKQAQLAQAQSTAEKGAAPYYK